MQFPWHWLSETSRYQTTINLELIQYWELLQPLTPPQLILWAQWIIPSLAGLALVLEDHLGTKNKRAHQSQRVVNRTNYTQKPSPDELSLLTLDLNAKMTSVGVPVNP